MRNRFADGEGSISLAAGGRAAIHDNRCVGVDNTATRNNPVIPTAGHGDRAVGSREHAGSAGSDSAKTCAVLRTGGAGMAQVDVEVGRVENGARPLGCKPARA